MVNKTLNSDFCLPDINECVTSNPCQNGARCMNMFGTYACECTLGWMGKDCDQGIYTMDNILLNCLAVNHTCHNFFRQIQDIGLIFQDFG